MLVLNRKVEEEIIITLEDGRTLTVKVVEIRSGRRGTVRLGFLADKSIKIFRKEVLSRPKKGSTNAGETPQSPEGVLPNDNNATVQPSPPT